MLYLLPLLILCLQTTATQPTPLTQSLNLLLSPSTSLTGLTSTSPNHASRSFTLPCNPPPAYVPAVTSLLASRGLSPHGSVRARGDLQEVLDSIDDAGRIPLLRYLDNSTSSLGPYLNNSIYPSAAGWNSAGTPISSKSDQWSISSVLAPPLAALVALENFYLSPQTPSDVDMLSSAFVPLYAYSAFLHVKRQGRIHHPFESGVPLSHPFWDEALKATISDMNAAGWSPSTPVPDSVKESLMYPESDDVYLACLYLLELQSSEPTPPPFEMEDTTFTSLLTASDVALYQIAVILEDKNSGGAPSSTTKKTLDAWVAAADQNVESLWDDSTKRYVNSLISGSENASTYTPIRNQGSMSDFTPLFGLYSEIRFKSLSTPDYFMPEYKLDSMVTSVLSSSASISFDCGGENPYPTVACGLVSTDDQRVDPVLNYYASRGFEEQQALGVAHFLRNQTLDMVCDPETGDCTFGTVYEYKTGDAIEDAECPNMNSAVAAATVASLLSTELEFSFESAPPLNNSWVLVIIVCELFLVFAISVTCLVLSINLFRKLRRERQNEEEGRLVYEDQVEFEGLLAFDQSGILHGDEEEEEEEVVKQPSMWNIIMSVGEHLSPW